jgi:prolyl-tRNA synthetase
MRLKSYFFPSFKENPTDAQLISHRYMLRAGMIQQASAGIYSWLPLGTRVLKRIEQVIREEMDLFGCQEIIMPTLQSAELWKESGRYEGYGKEMLRMKDRHERELVYGPTAEEVAADIFRQSIKSYKELPQILYQIHWKFRDEIRPRFGVMRGREFLMKDGYSFDINFEAAKQTYCQIYSSYIKIFQRLGVVAIPVKADPGVIGGDLSHEFQIVAPHGESRLYYDRLLEDYYKQGVNDYTTLSELYAAADDQHNPEECPLSEEKLVTANGIEVGHIFYFGTKYSEPLKAQVTGPDGHMITPAMGSYGIGVSRLVAAIIEASHDDQGIIWPKAVSPFDAMILNLKQGDSVVDGFAEKAYQMFKKAGFSVLYDDREERAGVKFATADLIGVPWQVIIGEKGAAVQQAELKNRRTNERLNLSLESILTTI